MKSYLLDTSFLIALEEETAAGRPGPACRTLDRLPSGAVFVTPVTVAELLEGAEDQAAALAELATYRQTVIGWATALRCALNQGRATRRMGENDAWQAALAMRAGHTLIGRDHAFEGRSGLDYVDFTKR